MGEVSKPNGVTSFYDHLIGLTPLGDYSIEWKSWKKYDTYCVSFNGDYVGNEFDLESAKIFIVEHYTNLVNSCLIKEQNE